MKHQHDWLNEGADPTDNDPGPGLTDEGECAECGYHFDLSEVDLFFVVEDSGVSYMADFGPPVYWASGHLVCPQCKAELPYETASN